MNQARRAEGSAGLARGRSAAYGHRVAVGVARALALALLAAVLGCGDGAAPRPPRSFLMGFAALPPRMDTSIIVPAINYWSRRADAAIIHASPPWTALVRGLSPAAAVDTALAPLANYFAPRASPWCSRSTLPTV